MIGRLLCCAALLAAMSVPSVGQEVLPTLDQSVQPCCVKIYGAGGVAGLEAYQSGFLVSPQGHLVTADSSVLESGLVTVVLADGRRYGGKVFGADSLLRIAVVKIDSAGEELPAVDMSTHADCPAGTSLLVFSNLFNIAAGSEPVSLLRTHLAAVVSRRDAFDQSAVYADRQVLLLDTVTSNPGAAGGLVMDYQGRPMGMVGVEQRGRMTGGWLNYALPMQQVQEVYERVLSGDKHVSQRASVAELPVNELQAWGVVLVESVVARTPPYIDYVTPKMHESTGLRVDDLVVMVDGYLTGTVVETRRLLTLATGRAVVLTVERDGRLLEVDLPATPQSHPPEQP